MMKNTSPARSGLIGEIHPSHRILGTHPFVFISQTLPQILRHGTSPREMKSFHENETSLIQGRKKYRTTGPLVPENILAPRKKKITPNVQCNMLTF